MSRPSSATSSRQARLASISVSLWETTASMSAAVALRMTFLRPRGILSAGSSSGPRTRRPESARRVDDHLVARLQLEGAGVELVHFAAAAEYDAGDPRHSQRPPQSARTWPCLLYTS